MSTCTYSTEICTDLLLAINLCWIFLLLASQPHLDSCGFSCYLTDQFDFSIMELRSQSKVSTSLLL